MSETGFAPRFAAAALLHGVIFDGRNLSEVMQGEDGPLRKLDPAERARAQSLALAVLRNLQKLDRVLDHFLEKSPPLKVRNALRIAAVELLMDGIAPHAAVDAAVTLVGSSEKTAHLKGMTNAVARRIADQGVELWAADTAPEALPKFLSGPIAKHYGKPALAAIEAAHGVAAPLDLTVKSNPEDWADKLNGEVLPTGSVRLREKGQVTVLEGFETGDWWVQDAAAAIPAKALGDVDGLRVLDLCCAPGGKTLQLANAGAIVTALDISEQRMQRVWQNLARTKLDADLVVADAMRWEPEAKFDAILLDAPCSATGTIRRHPDLPFVKEGWDLRPLLKLQNDLLHRALGWLKPEGRMVYSTCSLLPAEGEKQMKTLPEGVRLKPIDATALGLEAAWVQDDGSLRLRPDYWAERGGMDGFYVSLLEFEG